MSLYFSRIALNRHAPTRALLSLLDPQDPNARADSHHRLVWTLFGDAKERPRDFLWRSDGEGRFYLLSARPPVGSDLFSPPQTKVFEPALSIGDRLQFTLRANATKDRAKISRMDTEARRGNSRRVDLVMDLLRAVPKEARAAERDKLAQVVAESWIKQQGVIKGFSPETIRLEGYNTLNLGRSRRRGMTLGILDLTGEIKITDPELFLPALASGFGRAKAWGCGLMLIKRAQ